MMNTRYGPMLIQAIRLITRKEYEIAPHAKEAVQRVITTFYDGLLILHI